MIVADWASKEINEKLEQIPDVKNGKVILFVEFSFSNGGLGGIDVNVSHKETIRPPKKTNG